MSQVKPLKICTLNQALNTELIGCFKRKSTLILIVESGSATVSCTEAQIKSGSCSVFHISANTTPEVSSDSFARGYAIHYENRLVESYFKTKSVSFIAICEALYDRQAIKLGKDQVFILSHLSELVENSVKQNSGMPLSLAAILVLLLSYLYSFNQETKATGAAQKGFLVFQRLIIFVKKDPLQKPNVKSYAGILGVSPNYLNKLAKQYAMISVKELLVRSNIDGVKLLLKEGRLNYKQIAAEAHYSDLPHLLRVFKKVTGRTLRQFSSNH